MADFGYDRINYGIHSICPFAIDTQKPYGILKVLGSATMTLAAEFQELFGGSNKNAWAVEASTISSEWTASVKSMPNFLFELFLGASVSEVAASTTGTVGDFKNIEGTSVLQAATGIATVTGKVGSESDLKDGIYIMEVASATTVDIYALTDIEFKKIGAANDLSFLDDKLLVKAGVVIVSATAVEIVGLGVELTGGSGVIAMTIGDTARFSVSSAHNGVSTIKIGSASTQFPEHKQLCLGAKRANGDVMELELHKVVGSGFGVPFGENEFAIPELSMKLVYDSCEDAVATIRAKRGAGSSC